VRRRGPGEIVVADQDRVDDQRFAPELVAQLQPRRAAAFGDTTAVVSGGLACVAGALLLAGLLPAFRRQRVEEPQPVLTQV
jgi:hypothetical protein